jgi:MFS family permease
LDGFSSNEQNNHSEPESGKMTGPGAVFSSLFPHPTYYGWRIVAAGLLACLFSSAGQTFLISLFIDPLITALDSTRFVFSVLYSLGTLGAALLTPWIGRFADRVSSRFYFASVMTGLGISLLGLSWAPSLLMVGLILFLLRLLGQGAIGIGVIKTSSGWFNLHRGRAIAIGGLGFAFGELLLPSVIHGMNSSIGWRESLATMGFVYIFLLAPAFAAVMRSRRPLEGDHEHLLDESAPRNNFSGASQPAVPWKDPVFWLLLLGVCLQPFVLTALIFHQVALVTEWQWGLGAVTTVLAAFAVHRIFSSYLTGLLFERISSVWGITLSSVAIALACGSVYIHLPFVLAPLVYGGLLGVSAGVITSTNAILWQERYGTENLGRLQGTVSAFRNGVTALSAPVAAWLLAVMGTASVLVTTMAALSILIGLVPLAIPLLGSRGHLWKASLAGRST